MNHSASHKGHTYKITHEAHKWGNCMAGKSCGFGERLKINFINLINFFYFLKTFEYCQKRLRENQIFQCIAKMLKIHVRSRVVKI